MFYLFIGKYYLFFIVGSVVMVIYMIVYFFIIVKKISISVSEIRIEFFSYKFEKYCDIGLIGEIVLFKNCFFKKFRFVGDFLK